MKKQCSKCKKVLSVDFFTKRSKDKPELRSACKKCLNAYERVYSKTEKYKERKRKQMKAYRLTEHGKFMTRLRNKKQYVYKKKWRLKRWINTLICKK